jgi:internalin A
MQAHRIAVLLSATILIAATAATAEDPVNIPDPALKAAVEAQLAIPNPTATDMLTLTGLSAPHQGIADLRGLEYAKNLRGLSLWDNRITDINALKDLTEITGLDLALNQISDISVLGRMTKLTFVGMKENQITNISPLAGLAQLTYLDLGYNYWISDIRPLAGLTQLTFLCIQGNQITDISPLANLTNLDRLLIGQNQISDITPLTRLTGLTGLGLMGNPLDNADMPVLAGMTNMTWLQLGGYHTSDFQLTDISVVANMPKLNELHLHSNKLEDITPLAGLTAMTWFDLEGEKIASISPLAGMTEMVYFYLYNTQVSDISVLAGFTKMSYLNLPYNRIMDLRPLAGLTALTSLRLDGNQIADISPLAGLTNLTNLVLTDNWLIDIRPLGALTNLTELHLDNNAYWDRPMRNQISDIAALANLTNLRILRLGGNQTRNLSPLVNLPGLSNLNLESNALADIAALTAMTSLDELWLNGNLLNAKACAVDIPLIQANNPGVVVHYDGCTQWWTLTVSSTEGGSVVMPGEDAFVYFTGELVPVEAAAEEGYQFTHWTGTAIDANVLLDPSAPHASVTVDSNYTLVAHFKPQEQPWSTVYFNGFDDQVGPEWSRSTILATPTDERLFLGQFGNGAVTFTLADLPPHTRMRLSFDLFVIRSWDGSDAAGPDQWSLTVDEKTLLNTTFANRPSSSNQAFPGKYPDEQHPPQTGAAEVDSLGYMYWSDIGPTSQVPENAVYHMVFTVGHDANAVAVDFSASGLEDLSNESWGLDNVKVEVVQDEGKAELSVSSTAGGSVVVPGTGAFTYGRGELVPIQAVADAGYHFTHWSGTAVDANKVADASSASTTVVMDGDYTLIANFVLNERTLTISSTTGGSVTGPGQGSFKYAQGTWVPIQAVPKAHYYFTHWSGTAVDAGNVVNAGLPVTSLTMDGDYTLVANFKIEQYRLTVSAGQGGSISVETRTGNTTTPWYDQPIPLLDCWTQVTITATPDDGWKFLCWGGTMGSTESSFTFELTQDYDLEAEFVPE